MEANEAPQVSSGFSCHQKNLRKVLAGWSWKPTKFSSSRLGSGRHQRLLENKIERERKKTLHQNSQLSKNAWQLNLNIVSVTIMTVLSLFHTFDVCGPWFSKAGKPSVINNHTLWAPQLWLADSLWGQTQNPQNHFHLHLYTLLTLVGVYLSNKCLSLPAVWFRYFVYTPFNGVFPV